MGHSAKGTDNLTAGCQAYPQIHPRLHCSTKSSKCVDTSTLALLVNTHGCYHATRKCGQVLLLGADVLFTSSMCVTGLKAR